MNKDIFAGFIAKNFNNCVNKGIFPDNLKHADVTPVHKKKDKNDKTNYRQIKYTTNQVYFQNFFKIFQKSLKN